MTFRHAGDAGDIVYALPAIKYMSGDRRAILYIEAAPYTRQRMTPDNWRGLDTLIKAQPYIVDVLPWNREPTERNMNDFRATMVRSLRQGQGKTTHITDWCAITFNLPLTLKDTPWLTVEPNRVARVVINRAGAGRPPHQVYQNAMFPWGRVIAKYGKDAVFIGTRQEHEVFCAVNGQIHYFPTATLFDAAKVIAGADLFIGNQSCCHSMAQGLGKPIILEVWTQGPNCLATRPNVLNVWNHDVQLPVLTSGFDSPVSMPEPPNERTEMVTAPDTSETSKYRHLAAHLCAANGVDLGSAGDPIVPWAIQVDLPQREYAIYNTTRPVSNIQWRGNAMDLPFKDRTLDWINSAHLLEDLQDWTPAIREWDRVLKVGGHMIISIPDHGRFRAAVAGGQGDNLSHKHEGRVGELSEYFRPMNYDVLRDSFVSDNPREYSILFIARKL